MNNDYCNLHLQGYQEPMLKNIDKLGISDDDLLALFNNIEEIKDFNEYVVVCLCMHYCVKYLLM